MKVHCDEGLATHIGPEPCAGVCEDVGEASAGEHIGQSSSRENVVIPGADAVHSSEGNMDGCASASARPTRRGLRPWHVRTLLAREPGDLWIDLPPVWWTPMLGFRAVRKVSDEHNAPGISGGLQTRSG